ncbi:MAG: UDP-N-acetylmuramate:L-alanyl-gamma-D-glutamyl-meso-diaminopimelate ligase [Myxococcales bacterium]|nr:UDP-N-acetylmuramate:L-alanyl-gamma-D-glutamyl-meso-diaminopimelate ligase [Myxococcales bacterium]
MGAFAGLLKAAGYRVTGSDVAFYPPMGDMLKAWGVETLEGYDAAHLASGPDCVVVGNVCRRDNPEARAAIDGGLAYRSFPKALGELFLATRRSFVVAGTHGKTTTTALVSWLLSALGMDPSFLVGGVTRNFDSSFRLGKGGAFVVEGDEYDSAFFEKIPKFWSYRAQCAILTSVEHDHIDIYPDPASYLDAFRGFVSRLPPDGLLVAHCDPAVVEIARKAPCKVVYYGLTTDRAPEGVVPSWQAAPIAPSAGRQPFELFIGGSLAGRYFSPLMGEHNLRNALAAMALLAEGASLPVAGLTRALLDFKGVRRRQELRAEGGGVFLYEDFAHHPTAVSETLKAVRHHHGGGRLIAVFEPRSATACRNLHQHDYPAAFDAADRVYVTPLGRSNIAEAERLDVDRVVADINARGDGGARASVLPVGGDALPAAVATLRAALRPGDTVLVMTNGSLEALIVALGDTLSKGGA